VSDHALYRFFDAEGALLYVGITNHLPQRLRDHDRNKPWFDNVANVRVEHFPDRKSVLDAEREAIRTEKPRHNIQHNRGAALQRRPSLADSVTWLFDGFTTELFLYPELDCSAMLEDYCLELDGEDQFQAYVDYVKRKHWDWFSSDSVPIYWSVIGDGVHEKAPFQTGVFGKDNLPFDDDFLTFNSWPVDSRTGRRLNWHRLPVKNHRFPEFDRALRQRGWMPSPLQPTCPLQTLLGKGACYGTAHSNPTPSHEATAWRVGTGAWYSCFPGE
jgi:predicted GIY-YIG superfamily endonuclease